MEKLLAITVAILCFCQALTVAVGAVVVREVLILKKNEEDKITSIGSRLNRVSNSRIGSN